MLSANYEPFYPGLNLVSSVCVCTQQDYNGDEYILDDF